MVFLWENLYLLTDRALDELKRIYVKFHEEEAKDSSITDEGRKWFKALEDLWNKYFRDREFFYRAIFI